MSIVIIITCISCFVIGGIIGACVAHVLYLPALSRCEKAEKELDSLFYELEKLHHALTSEMNKNNTTSMPAGYPSNDPNDDAT